MDVTLSPVAGSSNGAGELDESFGQEELGYGEEEEGEDETDPLILLGAGASLRNRKRKGKKGSMLGASLIFSGTAVGAGMIALPAEMAGAGWAPSQLTLLLSWVFTYVASMLVLELSWVYSEGGVPAGFFSVAGDTIGKGGQALISLLFWFLLTCLTVAYTAGGGEQIQQLAGFIGIDGAPFLVCSGVYLAIFASIGIAGTKAVDFVNRIFVYGVLIALAGLLGVGVPEIDVDLLKRTDWGRVYPEAVSICILAFGAMNTVPTILQYLGGDVKRAQLAIFFGSITPLSMYCMWTTTVLGIVAYSPDMDKDKVLEELSQASGSTTITFLVEVFSVCSIASSMAGISVSYIDFFLDAIGDAEWAPCRNSTSGRALAACVTLAPPLAFANLFQNSFLGALEVAGLVGGVSLYGVLPSVMVWVARRQHERQQGAAAYPPIHTAVGEGFAQHAHATANHRQIHAWDAAGQQGATDGDGETQSPALLSHTCSLDEWPVLVRAGGGAREAMKGRVGGGNALLVTFGALCTAVVVPEIVRQVSKLAGGGSVDVGGINAPGGL